MATADENQSAGPSRLRSFLFGMAGVAGLLIAMAAGLRAIPPGHPHGLPGLIAIMGMMIFVAGGPMAVTGWVFRRSIWGRIVLITGALVSLFAFGVYAIEFIFANS